MNDVLRSRRNSFRRPRFARNRTRGVYRQKDNPGHDTEKKGPRDVNTRKECTGLTRVVVNGCADFGPPVEVLPPCTDPPPKSVSFTTGV